MSFEDKTLEELYIQLEKTKRERNAKGPKHQDFKLAEIMIESINKTIREKEKLT